MCYDILNCIMLLYYTVPFFLSSHPLFQLLLVEGCPLDPERNITIDIHKFYSN